MSVTGIACFAPSRVAVGEAFAVGVRVLGEVYEVPCAGGWKTKKPGLRGPYNLNVQRGLHFSDDCVPEWTGEVRLDAEGALTGPERIVFDGENQGAYPLDKGDKRPIRRVGGFRLTRPGIHFLRVVDPASGVEGRSNAVCVTPSAPRLRLYWGDPHWQTFFSDGVRSPEGLYAFARDDVFLDFGAISDHVEGITDRQWDYFTAVTNDYDEPGRFVTLVGQEWTNHAPGHRNIYFRGDRGPVLRCDDPRYDTLEKLWKALEGHDAIAIPHHSANVVMGCDWTLGWNPKYEKAVEVYSVWGSSEMHEREGNLRPIRHCKGEDEHGHVLEALKMGFRFGFVGGGDIHDGRPGHSLSHLTRDTNPSGLTAALAPALTRDHIYDAIRDHRTYATTNRRIYLEAETAPRDGRLALRVRAASEDGIDGVAVVRGGETIDTLRPDADPRVVEAERLLDALAPDEFLYTRVVTDTGDMAWSSPVWG